jgi:predicted double-glycine peptidase
MRAENIVEGKMKRKTKAIHIIAGIVIALCALISCGITIVLIIYRINLPTLSGVELPAEHEIEWNNSLNLKQSYNTCGAYSAMAYIYSKSKLIRNPEEINKQITEKYGDNYIFPWGIINYCRKQGVEARIYWFEFQTNKQKAKWIEQQISRNEPVIVIVGRRNNLHYITILGYNQYNFMMYDSNKDRDENGNLTGNYTIPKKELISWWNSARFYGFPILGCISG